MRQEAGGSVLATAQKLQPSHTEQNRKRRKKDEKTEYYCQQPLPPRQQPRRIHTHILTTAPAVRGETERENERERDGYIKGGKEAIVNNHAEPARCRARTVGHVSPSPSQCPIPPSHAPFSTPLGHPVHGPLAVEVLAEKAVGCRQCRPCQCTCPQTRAGIEVNVRPSRRVPCTDRRRAQGERAAG